MEYEEQRPAVTGGEPMEQCLQCGELHPASKLTDTALGRVCADCLDAHFTYCEGCEEYQK